MIGFICKNIASELSINLGSVQNTVKLFEEGCTVPFVARYRKEATDGLDEVKVFLINSRLIYFKELENRKKTIINSIDEQGKLSPSLQTKIEQCVDKQFLEDLYLPYKQKRKTRASVAKQRGLEPLARIIYKQDPDLDIKSVINRFISPEKEVNSASDAWAGARDIIAQEVAENASFRRWIRDYFLVKGILETRVKKDFLNKKTKYEMYYKYSIPLKRVSAHNVLAIRRAEKEKVISWKINIDNGPIEKYLRSKLVRNRGSKYDYELTKAIEDSVKRLIYPAIENECFSCKIDMASDESILVFSKNLRNILLASPVGQKVIMGIDPGIRTGCKVAVIDFTGKYLCDDILYLTGSDKQKRDAINDFCRIVKKYQVEFVAVGNGTASKETLSFVKQVVKSEGLQITPVMVSESGASVYSASEIARNEFPDLDLTVRGAISIARRLQDPLSELVKVDAKSIGVGQYQHDVNQKDLKESLANTVESCVNYVGVDLNTASSKLLENVSGIGPALASNIVQYREANGPFLNRKALLKVPKFGKKAFEQSAGFLRIRDGNNPLDNSAIHPESYYVVENITKYLGANITDLIGNEPLIDSIDESKYISDKLGVMTFRDILNELKKPGLDPREDFAYGSFRDDINEISDLKAGMKLNGVVTNVTNFGAFVDVGVHQDGLIHISKMSESFVNNPYDIVSVGDKVRVEVLTIDLDVKRINLRLLTS